MLHLSISPTSRGRTLHLRRSACAVLAVGALAACATRTGVDAQWSDPQMAGTTLQGQRVLVVCEAAETVLARICLDQLAATLQARGATPVTLPDSAAVAAAQPTAGAQVRDDARYVAQARSAGAQAVWVAALNPDLAAADQRGSSGVSIGIGGFSFGRGGGAGVGVSVPIGGQPAGAAPAYAASARVTDVPSGRLVWTATVGGAPAGDVAGQVDNLLQRLVTAAAGARLF
jgi:hypothetical protein